MMRKALTASAVLHLAVLLLAVLVVPMFDEKLDLEPSMIPIDIVEVGPVASPRQGEARPEPPPAAPKPVAAPPAEAVPPPPPPAPRAPEPPPPPAPPPPPKPAPPPPEPKAEVPDKPKPHEKPQPPKPEPPKVEPPKPAPPKVEPPKPEPPKPAPPKPPEKQKPPEKKPEKPAEKPPDKKPAETDPLASVLSHVAELAKKQPPAPPAPASQPSTAKPSPSSGSSPMVADHLTGPQEDALRSQIGHCWNVDPGARNAHDMIIDVVIEVNPDRTVAKAEIAEKSRARMYTDPAYRAAAEAALRAVKNPRCQPLALPPEKYDTWRRITFTFNPKDML